VRPELGDAGAHLRRDFGQPDGCLDGFDLAEERADALEWVMPPMRQEARGLRCDKPLVGVWQIAPCLDIGADFVVDRRRVVFLLLGGEIAEQHLRLVSPRLAPLPGLGNRRDEVRAAAGVDDPVCRLPVLVQLPVLLRVFIGGSSGSGARRTSHSWLRLSLLFGSDLDDALCRPGAANVAQPVKARDRAERC
jgi:hypothetical protein